MDTCTACSTNRSAGFTGCRCLVRGRWCAPHVDIGLRARTSAVHGHVERGRRVRKAFAHGGEERVVETDDGAGAAVVAGQRVDVRAHGNVASR